jgi:hypothetical protein
MNTKIVINLNDELCISTFVSTVYIHRSGISGSKLYFKILFLSVITLIKDAGRYSLNYVFDIAIWTLPVILPF